jgi:hypothetical protein
MKKIQGIVALAIFFMMSCTDKTKETKKETVVVPTQTQTVTPPAKPTTITLDKNGVKVEAKKIDITVKQ